MNHINKTDLKVEGANLQNDPPMKVENLLIHTDDYGGVREWALLGFSNNILRNEKVKIKIYGFVIRQLIFIKTY